MRLALVHTRRRLPGNVHLSFQVLWKSPWQVFHAGSISYHESGGTAWERPVVCQLAMTGLRQMPINRWLPDVTAG
jgi:hypothetical protein